MTGPLDTSRPIKGIEGLERQVAKLEKINRALMHRVEKSMDQQANAYSLFQTAISLEEQVRVRTEELTRTRSATKWMNSIENTRLLASIRMANSTTPCISTKR